MATADAATEQQTKRLYAVLHSVESDYREFEQEHGIAMFPIGNVKAPSQGQIHHWIDELEEMEAEKNKPQLPRKPDEMERFGGRTQDTQSTKPTVPELIAKYTDMLALVTEAVMAEERIPDREKGYGVKFIFDAVKDAMENGGDHEE